MLILSLIADTVKSLCFWMLWKISLQLQAQQDVPPRPFSSQKTIWNLHFSSVCCLSWAATSSYREMQEGDTCVAGDAVLLHFHSLEELELVAPSNIQELLDFPLITTSLQKHGQKPPCNS